ncbi:MAG: rhodanese-like domain-containing protein [Gammaproteobacteria bacterium]|nr:rhodanese-like domain-containing protein [Gammaproteobacteria bacterium]
MLRKIIFTAIFVLVYAPAQADLQKPTLEQAKELMNQGIPVIDVRTAPEWKETGVIEDSHLLTFFDENGNYDVQAWMARLKEIAAPDQPIMLICRTGARSDVISDALFNQLGYNKVYDVTDGIEGWLRQGNPTTPYE